MSNNIKTVVIGTSLGELSDAVVRTGVAAARAAGASPWLLHAYMPPVYSAELVDGRMIELQAEALRESLAQQARRTGLADLPGFKPDHLQAVMGSPPREIVELARQVKADLIVVGAQEGGALHRIVLGSTADGVIRRAPCPVLAVRSESAFPPARVEIPVDLSPISAKAFQKGLSFLGEMGVPLAETEVLFVLNRFEMGGSIHFNPEQIERFAGEELRHFMEVNSPGRPPRLARIRTGYPREEIAGVLEERQVDLAVLGTHGRSGFERVVIGSVAAEIMHKAACNLLLIPPEAGVEAEEGERELPLPISDWIYISGEAPAVAGRL